MNTSSQNHVHKLIHQPNGYDVCDCGALAECPLFYGADADMCRAYRLCPQCRLEGNKGICDRKDCSNFDTRNPSAVALGSIKSDKKAKASRENGKKGGHPRLPKTSTNTHS